MSAALVVMVLVEGGRPGRLPASTIGQTQDMAQEGVRIAELVATMSYAADLGLGQPMEHCLRQTVIALRMADLAAPTPDDREATYYLGMLVNSYCHADASEQAKWFGDDISFKGDGFEVLAMSSRRWPACCCATSVLTAAPRIGYAAWRRSPSPGSARYTTWLTTHTKLSSQFADRIGLGEDVRSALWQAYEQWDGKGPRH